MNNRTTTWPRLYVTDSLASGGSLTLNTEQSHYLLNVLRAQQGDSVRLFNGQDGEWQGMIDQIPKSRKNGLNLKLLTRLREQDSVPELELCCAPIRKAHFDFMIMKATEIGARAIQPILTERTQVRDPSLDRLTAIAIEAAEQSERLSIPVIRKPRTIDELIATWPHHRLALLCAEFGKAQPIVQALGSALAKARSNVAIITGPEGGFTTQEMEKLHTLPEVLAVRLGPRILRADTAAIAAMSCWQALCGDWQSRDSIARPDTKPSTV